MRGLFEGGTERAGAGETLSAESLCVGAIPSPVRTPTGLPPGADDPGTGMAAPARVPGRQVAFSFLMRAAHRFAVLRN